MRVLTRTLSASDRALRSLSLVSGTVSLRASHDWPALNVRVSVSCRLVCDEHVPSHAASALVEVGDAALWAPCRIGTIVSALKQEEPAFRQPIDAHHHRIVQRMDA